MLKLNKISVGTPIVEPSNKIYIIGGDSVILTCKIESDNNEDVTYQWELNDDIVYVSLCILDTRNVLHCNIAVILRLLLTKFSA